MRFKPGQSGNPAGRPVGSRNKRTIATEKLLGPNGEQFAQLAIELAKMGHPVAVRLCLDWVWPRERWPAFRLPPVRTAKDRLDAMNLLLQGVADGELTPAQAAKLSEKVRAALGGGQAGIERRTKRPEALVADRRG
jgi:Family of unknown function (DUF5681)